MTSPVDSVQPDDIDERFAPRAAAHVASVEIDGEAVLYDEERETVHLLSPTATVLWNCFDGSGTIAEIAADVADAYEVDVAIVCEDIVRTTRELGRHNLIAGVVPDPEPDPDVGMNAIEAELMTDDRI
jgi:hypothetical protein